MEQYINKAALVAEIERRINELSQLEKASYEVGLFDAYKITLSFLDTLEVKKVNLEEEVANWWDAHYKGLNDDYKFGKYNGHYMQNSTVISLAKHFYELGLNDSRT